MTLLVLTVILILLRKRKSRLKFEIELYPVEVAGGAHPSATSTPILPFSLYSENTPQGTIKIHWPETGRSRKVVNLVWQKSICKMAKLSKALCGALSARFNRKIS